MTAHLPVDVETKPSEVMEQPVAVPSREFVSMAYDTIPVPDPPDDVSTNSVPYVPVVLVIVRVF